MERVASPEAYLLHLGLDKPAPVAKDWSPEDLEQCNISASTEVFVPYSN